MPARRRSGRALQARSHLPDDTESAFRLSYMAFSTAETEAGKYKDQPVKVGLCVCVGSLPDSGVTSPAQQAGLEGGLGTAREIALGQSPLCQYELRHLPLTN